MSATSLISDKDLLLKVLSFFSKEDALKFFDLFGKLSPEDIEYFKKSECFRCCTVIHGCPKLVLEFMETLVLKAEVKKKATEVPVLENKVCFPSPAIKAAVDRCTVDYINRNSASCKIDRISKLPFEVKQDEIVTDLFTLRFYAHVMHQCDETCRAATLKYPKLYGEYNNVLVVMTAPMGDAISLEFTPIFEHLDLELVNKSLGNAGIPRVSKVIEPPFEVKEIGCEHLAKRYYVYVTDQRADLISSIRKRRPMMPADCNNVLVIFNDETYEIYGLEFAPCAETTRPAMLTAEASDAELAKVNKSLYHAPIVLSKMAKEPFETDSLNGSRSHYAHVINQPEDVTATTKKWYPMMPMEYNNIVTVMKTPNCGEMYGLRYAPY